MKVSLENWIQLTSQVEPKDNTGSHKWISHTNDWKGYEVTDNPSKKLTLGQILKVTKLFLNQYKLHEWDNNYKILENEVSQIVHTSNLFKTDIDIFQEIESLCNLKKMMGSISKMNERAVYNRTQERTNSVWGKVKWYIWSWFFDNTAEINTIYEKVPGFDELKNKAIDTLRERININCGSEIESLQQLRDWIRKKHPDKQASAAKNADDTPSDEELQRVIIMRKLWIKLEALQPTDTIVTSKKSQEVLALSDNG